MMNNLKKSSLIALIVVGCLVAFTGAASANSVTLTKSGGTPGPSSYSITDIFTVTVFANLGPTGGGQKTIIVSLNYDSSQLTAVACAEAPGILLGTFPAPLIGQFVGGGVYSPLTPNCGAGSPADGGLLAGPGLVLGIDQNANPAFANGTSGTLVLGTVTFHAKAPGPTSIIASTLGGGGGFLGGDFVTRIGGIPVASVSVTVVPEPATLVLLGLGVLGLGLSGRRLRRR